MDLPNGSIKESGYLSKVGETSQLNRESSFARMMLFFLVLIVGVGPRISLSFLAGEVRIQDALIPLLALYLILSPKPRVKDPVRRLLGNALPIFLFSSFITVLLSIMFLGEVSALRRVTFYGRTLEMIVLAVIVAGLYLRSGSKALNVVMNGIALGAVLNLSWFFYQIVTGESTTLFGQEVSSQIESYGPRLIGEPSAFGVGQYWAFIAAVSAAQIKCRTHVWSHILLMLAAFWATIMAESRISMGSILLIAGLLLVLGPDRKRPVDVLGALGGVILIAFGLTVIFPVLGDRFSPGAIESSLQVRIDTIWIPHLDRVLQNPFIGIGPGGLVGSGNQSEAHNILIRAMLDFGVFVGVVFLSLFIITLYRSFRIARSIDVDRNVRTVAYVATFSILSILISGLVQDSLTAVMSSHLAMLSIGIMAAQRALWIDDGESIKASTVLRS